MKGLHITPLLCLVLCCYDEFIQMEGKVVYERMKEVNGLRSYVEVYSQRDIKHFYDCISSKGVEYACIVEKHSSDSIQGTDYIATQI